MRGIQDTTSKTITLHLTDLEWNALQRAQQDWPKPSSARRLSKGQLCVDWVLARFQGYF